MASVKPKVGVIFHSFESPDDPVVLARTRNAIVKWASAHSACTCSSENVENTYNRVRAANPRGVIPWVYVDPLAEEIYGRCELEVEDTYEDADGAAKSLAAGI